jgi:hypothetical protein
MVPGASLGRTGRRVGYIDSAACRNSTRGVESNRLRVYLYTQGTPLEQLPFGRTRGGKSGGLAPISALSHEPRHVAAAADAGRATRGGWYTEANADRCASQAHLVRLWGYSVSSVAVDRAPYAARDRTMLNWVAGRQIKNLCMQLRC